MGQKINPEGFRIGYIHDWKSNWFDERNFSDMLIEDVKIRGHIEGSSPTPASPISRSASSEVRSPWTSTPPARAS